MEKIWERYTRARLGIGEPLQSPVYYGLTVIEAHFGSRANATTALNLVPQILRKTGKLSSTRGTPDTSRKTRVTATALNRQEVRWLDQAVRQSLLQLGHVAAGLMPPAVAITDIPDLP